MTSSLDSTGSRIHHVLIAEPATPPPAAPHHASCVAIPALRWWPAERGGFAVARSNDAERRCGIFWPDDGRLNDGGEKTLSPSPRPAELLRLLDVLTSFGMGFGVCFVTQLVGIA